MGGDNKSLYNPNDLDSIDTRIPHIAPHLIEYQINPRAFINAHNFPNLDALVEEVKRIDNDNNAYESMRNEPLFLNNFNPKRFYEKKILDFFDNIFSQPPNLAFRRGEGQRMDWYRNLLTLMLKPDNAFIVKKFKKYKDLGNGALRIARFYDWIHKSTRPIRHALKFWKQ